MSLASYLKVEYDNYLSRMVVEGVKEAVWPWQTDGIALLLDYDIDNFSKRLIIEVYFRYTNDWMYVHVQPLPEYSEPEETIAIVIQGFTECFRRWRQTPEDNIILGEN